MSTAKGSQVSLLKCWLPTTSQIVVTFSKILKSSFFFAVLGSSFKSAFKWVPNTPGSVVEIVPWSLNKFVILYLFLKLFLYTKFHWKALKKQKVASLKSHWLKGMALQAFIFNQFDQLNSKLNHKLSSLNMRPSPWPGCFEQSNDTCNKMHTLLFIGMYFYF